jgi:phosphatidylglycerol:prolipoprotein diacylglycerol transferase
MLPYIELFGRTIPSYGLLGVSGTVLGLITAVLCCGWFDLDRENCAYLYVFGAIGAVAGAKILYLITAFSDILKNIQLLWQNPMEFAERYLAGGLVFYGGLIGAIIGALLCARYFSLRLRDYFPVLVPVFPLIHAIGRIGCFMVGCCYGRQSNWGIAFSNSIIAPNGVKLIPTQLIEALAEILICLLLLWCARKRTSPMRLLAIYFSVYAPVRFTLEFFRGDAARGFLWNMSTSQWISIAVFLTGVILWIFQSSSADRKRI